MKRFPGLFHGLQYYSFRPDLRCSVLSRGSRPALLINASAEMSGDLGSSVPTLQPPEDVTISNRGVCALSKAERPKCRMNRKIKRPGTGYTSSEVSMTSWTIAVALTLMSLSSDAMAQSKNGLIGTWKLISAKDTTESGEVRDAFGPESDRLSDIYG